MKEDTKEKVAMVGLMAVGLYILTRDKDETYAGFGGGGGIPLLPGDTEGAAEGDSIINYILPSPEPFGGFGIDEAEPEMKKMTYAPSIIPTYPLEYYTAGGVSELSEFATPAQKLKSVMELQHYQDPFAYAFSGRRDAPADVSGIVDTKKDEAIAQTPKEPVQWGEASVGGFMDYLYPITQLGKGARGRDIAIKPDKDIRGGVSTKKIVESRSVATKRTTGSSRGWQTWSPSTTVSVGGTKYTKGSSGTLYRKVKTTVALQRGQTKKTSTSTSTPSSSGPGRPDYS